MLYDRRDFGLLRLAGTYQWLPAAPLKKLSALKTLRREAELLLQRSLSGSEELVLEAPFSFAGELGDAASAPDGLCAPVRKDWCIWSLCYHWRPSDIGCTVTLRPKTHF